MNDVGGWRRVMTFAAHMEMLTIRCIWRVRAVQAASSAFGRGRLLRIVCVKILTLGIGDNEFEVTTRR